LSNGDASHDASSTHGSGNNPVGGAVNGPADKKRRYFLIKATVAVAAVGAAGAAVPFVQYWNPSAKAKALGAPVTIDISKLAPGEMLSPIVAWRGKPVFIIYRDEATLEALETGLGNLADPDSENADMQPEFAVNSHRSMKPAVGIFLGICTHLGCSPKYVAADNFPGSGGNEGGFFCPCHGSRFDLAGRVVSGVPAPDNLEVPPYRYESDTVIVIGETQGTA
jgi:ubiquinol-cytochrome c reductase iron-sulfur subunit